MLSASRFAGPPRIRGTRRDSPPGPPLPEPAGPSAPGTLPETPAALGKRWKEVTTSKSVVGFYGHSEQWGKKACFSNFFKHKPYTFSPPACCLPSGAEVPTYSINVAERAVMLCNAHIMRDSKNLERIKTAPHPTEIKSLGRAVKPWSEDMWQRCVCTIARAAVVEKFKQIPELRDILLETAPGDTYIAEATRNDSNWGIGMDVDDPGVKRPGSWKGTNVLGWALMEARDELLVKKSPPIPTPPTGDPKACRDV